MSTITYRFENKTWKSGNDKIYSYSKVIPANPSGIIERIPFYVPSNLKTPITFEIKCEGGFTFSHSDKTIEVKLPKDRMFIQTDKPVYKPGGKGM